MQYAARGNGYNLFLTPGEAVFAFGRPAGQDSGDAAHGPVLRLDVVGANLLAPVSGLDALASHSNYFQADQALADIPNYRQVLYRGIYPGIDLAFHGATGNPGQLEYDFILHPGSSASTIHLAYQGASGLSLDGQGGLDITTAAGQLVEHAPVLYQQTADGARHAVSGSFTLGAGGNVGFAVGNYDAGSDLVIDPVTAFSSYSGGSGNEQGLGITSDAAGNSYIVGSTTSLDFPVSGGYQTTLGGGIDGFIEKISPTGARVFSSYLGGSSTDILHGVAVGSDGSIYVTGSSTSSNYPVTVGVYQSTLSGSSDIVLSKLSAAGNSLSFSTYYGGAGPGSEEGLAIQLDSSGNVLIAGDTASTSLPTTLGAYQVVYGGGTSDAFLAKFNSSGTSLLYASYYGGTGNDVANALALNSSGKAVLAGTTTGGLPTTTGAYAVTYGGGSSDGFLAVINPVSLGGLSYGSYLGGSAADSATGVSVDSIGNMYVVGQSFSSNFATSVGAFQTTLTGTAAAFLTKFNGTGSLVYSTLLGGSGTDGATAVVVNSAFQATVVGSAGSSNFPTSPTSQATAPGGGDAFVSLFNSSGSALLSSLVLGGSAADQANGVTLDADGNTLVVGTTASTNFPLFSSLQGANAGGSDAFALKLAAAPPPVWPPDDGGLVRTAAGASGNAPSGSLEGGVRAFDGVIKVSAADLSSDGFGTPWGQTRSWSNGPGYAWGSSNGNSWVDDQLPVLEMLNGGATLAVVTNAATARYFDVVAGNFVARYDDLSKLTYSSANHEYILTDTLGDQVRFNDFAAGPANANGRFKSYTDPDGNVTSVTSWNSAGQPLEVQRSSTLGTTTIIESYLYSYLSSGTNAGLMQTATLRRQTNGGSWTTVRQVAYSYYDGTTSYGNAGDLRLAQVEDAASNVLDTSYYRYYTPSDTGGYTHGLKYSFGPEAYARLVAAYATPTTATDSQVAPYADLYLQYNSSHAVTQETLAGAGASSGNGGNGLGTYSYAYTASSNSPGFNSWTNKIVESMPDSTTNTVYTNAYGEEMLSVFQSGTQKWEIFHKYDSSGREILSAAPSALTGWDDTKADLLNSVSGNYQYMSDNTGLVSVIDYYASTTAGETTAGGVAGYVQDHKVQQGELGTAILQDTAQYFAHSYGGTTIAPVAASIVYRNTDGTGSETTSYAYTWFSGTAQIQSETTTLPVISSGQNGPGSADSAVTYFDSLGRSIWHKDGDGYIDYTAYDQATSAVVKSISDVNTANTGDFTGLPSGWTTPSGGGLHLITQDVVDTLGRTTQATDAAGDVTYTVYNDTNYETLVYADWNSTTNTPTGPTQVSRQDRAHTVTYTESLTMTATPHLTGGKPDGTEAISSIQTLSRDYTNSEGQAVTSDVYFNLSAVTYSTANYIGTQGTNFYRTTEDYDNRGRRNRTASQTGTIDRTVYDDLGRATGSWQGTNDTPMTGQWSPSNNTGSANMFQVSASVYDGGNVGDGNLTSQTSTPGGTASNRVSLNYYDWRDRLVATKDGDQGGTGEDTTTHRPIMFSTLDNLGEVTSQQQFDGDGVTITSSGGVPQAPSASLLRAQTNTSFDEQGRAYLTQSYSVNQSTGAVSTYALATNTYFNHRGQIVATFAPGSPVTKTQYDGAGRATIQYVTDGAAGTTWTQARSVTGDNVLEQTETTYDSAGNAILTVIRQRNHDETATGSLGNAITSPKARVSYVAAYYDQGNRLTATVDVGTNGGSAWTRPGTVPTASDTVLVTSRTYSPAGYVATRTDPRGIVTQNTYDNQGRVTKTIEAYTDGTPTINTNKTTNYTYDGSGHTLTVSAVQVGGTSQTTQFVYGVTGTRGISLTSNDVLSAVQHPDKTTGNASSSEQDSYTVNALGQVLTFTDRNGTVHSYTYDVLGRQTSDTISTLGTGVDNAVQRIDTAYDTGGRPYLFTSYATTGTTSIVNQVQDVYNGLGQLTTEYQSHSGAVNTSTSPKVQYAYTEMSGGVNHSRIVSMTYPNGRVLNYNYNTGLDSTISRLSSISDSSATLETYAYLGLGTVVKRGHPEPGVDLTYIKQNGEANGDAGDQYIGLDRFGRVVDQRWIVTANGTHTDRFQYAFDRNGNRLYRNNLVNTAFSELYHASGAGNGYDNLNQLVAFSRGTLSASGGSGTPLDTIGSPSHTQTYTTDALGNFSSVMTDGTTQNRTHNQQNEVTAAGSSTLAFDKNGNLTTDDLGHTLIFDAWNRLVQVKNGSTVLSAYSYDAQGRLIVTTSGGTTTDLYLSNQWQVLEERVGGNAKVQYVWSPVYVDALVERDRDPTGGGTLSERLYVQQDANWNVTAVVNTSGSVVERYVEDPYGAVTFLTPSWGSESSSSVSWVYLHQGLRLDGVAGLLYVRGRWESVSLMRWVQPDPMGFAAGDVNWYRDEGNAPTNAMDPTGLISKSYSYKT